MAQQLGALLEVARIQSEINRLFDNLLDLDAAPEGGVSWQPNVDILETEGSLELSVELPGVDADSVSLKIHSGNVIVEGVKARPEPRGEIQYHTAERAFGAFRRVVQLGVPVNTRIAKARLADGLLRITFPRVPDLRGEVVTIEVERT